MSERVKDRGETQNSMVLGRSEALGKCFSGEISDTSNYAKLPSIKEQLVRREWTI